MKHPRHLAILTVLSLAVPGVVVGQQGAITFDRATRLAIELPPEVQSRFGDEIPGESFDTFVLLFSPTETVMLPAPEEEADEDDDVATGSDASRSRRLDGMISRLQRMSPERSDQERIMVAHTDLNTGSMVENRVFMGRTFLITGDRPPVQWRLTGEQSEFAGHLVMRALASVDSTEVEAWFTPQIPVPGGPAEYGGLPGMILSLSIDGGRIIYSATGVRSMPVDEGAIRPPTQGQEVGRDEYERIVAERLEELRFLREQRGPRRGGG